MPRLADIEVVPGDLVGDAYASAEIRMAGELDILTGPLVELVVQSLVEMGVRTIKLDLTHLRFVDHAGLASLARSVSWMSEHAGDLVVVRGPVVRRLLFLSETHDTGRSSVIDLTEGTGAARDLGDQAGHEQSDLPA